MLEGSNFFIGGCGQSRVNINKPNKQYLDEYSHGQEKFETNDPFEDKAEP